tara:strand:- start:120 stop:785 length:666 start_codon:yes stop_codon:yes gene_type:complete
MKTIYYTYSMGEFIPKNRNSLPEDYFLPPEKYLKDINNEYFHSKCPAWKYYYKNTFTIRQQFPLQIKNDTEILANMEDAFAYDKYFDLKGHRNEFQMLNLYMFWTDAKDVWVEQTPHPELTRKGLDLVCASFPISEWNRPISIGVVMNTDHVKIDRGDPLYNVRFTSKGDHNVSYKLVKREFPQHLDKKAMRDLELQHWQWGESWKLIKQRLDRKPRCPFR